MFPSDILILTSRFFNLSFGLFGTIGYIESVFIEVFMKNKFMSYLRDESGQTSTEYILLVFVAAFIVMKFKGKIEQELLEGNDSVLGKVFKKVDENLESM
jgi:pilus assembly protein Flp/PilA